MKRLALFCGAMLLFAGIASAQDDASRAELFGGYSYVHVSDHGATANLNGGSASLAYNLTSWLGVVGDFGGYHGGNNFGNANVYSYLFGPKISYHRGPITPFGQVLFGGAHLTGSAAASSENDFAMTFGGGVDWNATSHLGIRLIQAEYLMTKFTDGLNNRQNNARISTGVVFRF
jgi:hypothetical protein